MASSVDFIEYVCEQLRGVGNIRYRKMFGEYMLYVNEKPVLLICNDTVYVKKLACIEEEMQDAATGIPYSGSREHYILDIDNADFSRRIVAAVEAVTAVPVPKKKPAKKEK